jgi:hypothetical protein
MVLMVCDPVEILCSFQFNVTSFIFDWSKTPNWIKYTAYEFIL